MKAKKVEKLHRDIADQLNAIRTAAVRLEGRLKVAAQVDAKAGPERDTLLKLAAFPAGLLGSVDEVANGLPGILSKITEPDATPAPKPEQAAKQETAKK